MSNHPYLLYGAYGFTGKLIAQLAKEKGHQLLLAGRDEAKTKELANDLGYPYLAFDLSDTQALDSALQQVKAVLHCAGPFSATAAPMIAACLKNKVHYLDITGEIDVFELAASQHDAAKNAGMVLMPGVGFDVVPSDCLALHLKQMLPTATSLEMGFQGVSKLSRGTALTMAENMHRGGMIRENGVLKNVPSAYKVREEFVHDKKRTFVSIPWGDVSTAYYSTSIPNITIYTGVHPRQVSTMRTLYSLRGIFKWGIVQWYIKNKINKVVKGPDETLLNEGSSFLWGEVRDAQGKSHYATLETLEGYKLTSITALMALERVLGTSMEGGFYTPAKAFGANFILEVAKTSRKDRK